MFLNASIPIFKCFIRKEFLYNLKEHHGEFEECTVFGVASVRGRAFGFHVLLPNGAIFYRVPLHAFCHKEDAPRISIFNSQYWDCFSYHISVCTFELLKNIDVEVFLKSKSPAFGEYMFTIDWCTPSQEELSGHSEIPDEHKCAHIIKLDDGNYCAYPNNRIKWLEASFVTEPFDKDSAPDYKSQTHMFSGEINFKTENSDKFFYKSDRENTSDLEELEK